MPETLGKQLVPEADTAGRAGSVQQLLIKRKNSQVTHRQGSKPDRPEHHWYTPSISGIGEVPAQSSEDTKRQHPPQSQPFHPAAIWQKI